MPYDLEVLTLHMPITVVGNSNNDPIGRILGA